MLIESLPSLIISNTLQGWCYYLHLRNEKTDSGRVYPMQKLIYWAGNWTRYMWFQIHSASFCPLKLITLRRLFPPTANHWAILLFSPLCVQYVLFIRMFFFFLFTVLFLKANLLFAYLISKSKWEKVEIAFWNDLWGSGIEVFSYPKGHDNISQMVLASHHGLSLIAGGSSLF